MANTYKVAGQVTPVANTDTVLYTVPATKQFVSSSINICNRSLNGDPDIFRIAIVPVGDTLSNKHYIYYDAFIDIRKTLHKVIGISLQPGDQVIVRAGTANLSFSLFGSELFNS